MKQYREKIPMDTSFIKSIVKAIENADYLYRNYLQEENFPTDNGSEGAKWNYINREVKNDVGEETLDRILEKLIAKIDGSIERYVLISFDILHGQVTAMKGTIPAVGMNYYKEEDWADLLNASYSSDDTGVLEEVPEEIVMLERKPKLCRRKRKKDHGSAEQK